MRKQEFKGIALASMLLMAAGCSSNYENNSRSGSALSEGGSGSFAAALQSSASIEVRNGSSVIYSATNKATSLTVERGVPYQICVSSSLPGTTGSVSLKGAMIASGPANGSCHNLTVNDVPGIYELALTSSSPGAVTTTTKYSLSVTCPQNELVGMSASDYVTGVSITGTNNSYRFAATGPQVSANDCDWAMDVSGDGIVDTEFVPCSQAIQNLSNRVGQRPTARLLVREKQCNHTMAENFAINLPWSMPSNNVIHVQAPVAATQGPAANMPRLNLQHLSTNVGGAIMVQCSYNNGRLGIEGLHNYSIRRGLGSHGFRLSYTGLTGSIRAGNVSGASASMSETRFATDFDVDQSVPIEFNGNATQCRGTVAVQALPVSGKPCATVASGSVNQYTIKVNGSFGCSDLRGSDGLSRINVGGSRDLQSGTFMCMINEVDDCPGGAPGGGGTPPQSF